MNRPRRSICVSSRALGRMAAGLVLATVVACKPKPAAPGTGAGAAPTNAPAAELAGAMTWLNSPEIKLASLRGKVVLVQFFEYTCVNCLRTLPYLKEWQRRYAALGLTVIGVHSAQYEFSSNPTFVYAAIQRLGVTYPVAVDSYLKITETYNNRSVPRLLLIDQDGNIRLDHNGETGYSELEPHLQRLLAAIHPDVKFPAPLAPLRASDRPGAVCELITPELYLGRARGQLANLPAATTAAPTLFELPETLEESKIYAGGEWENASEYLRHTRDQEKLTDAVVLKYRAVEANVVMKPEGIYWLKVFVQQNGQWLPRATAGEDIKFDEEGRSYVPVNAARMYNLTTNQPYAAYELRLIVQGKGLSVYSFSFGTCERSAASGPSR